MSVEVRFANQPGERKELVRALETFAQTHRLPRSVVSAADLALEELVTNVLNYGLAPGQPADIRVRFAVAADLFSLEVDDNGRPFNPLDRPEVDTTLPLEEKPIGGLGIHLIRKFMDEVAYRNENGRNILTMRKRFAPET